MQSVQVDAGKVATTILHLIAIDIRTGGDAGKYARNLYLRAKELASELQEDGQ